MNWRAAWLLACLLLTTPAAALQIEAEPPAPRAIGQSHTFRIAQALSAEGDVTYRWNFGDGTVVDNAAAAVEHIYTAPGHYTVIVGAADAAGNRTSTSWIQTAHTPVTASPPSNSSSVVFDAARQRVWNVNLDAGTVTATDTATLTKLFEIAVGAKPRTLARAPDGSVWVAAQDADRLAVLDPESGTELGRVPLPYGSQPYGVAIGAAAGKAYVSLFATGELVEIDLATRVMGRRLALGPTPAGVSVAADGRVFVTRYVSPEAFGEVWVVSPSSFTVVKTIQLPMDPGPDSESHGRGVPNYVSSFVISPDGTQAWVTAKKDNVVRGPMRDGLPMNPDSFVRAIVCVVDLMTEAEVLTKRADIDNRALPTSVAFSPVGDLAYVLLQGSNWVGIFDAYRVENLGGIKDIGKAPDGLAFSSDGKLFVDSFLTRELFVFDMAASLAFRDHQAPPPLAQLPVTAREPLSLQVLLGKQVFYDAADKRMSAEGYMSCASCHFDGGSDARVWDLTDRGEGLRNTKSLLGIGGPGQGPLHWTANFDEMQDFERDIRESLGGTGFMPADAWAAHQGDPFGAPSAGASPELDALSAFVLSLTEVGRSPFRNSDGSFTASARRGRDVFARAGCPSCHAAPTFTNSATRELYNVGTQSPTSGNRLGAELTGIDTPTLKGLWQSAPYLHDGRAATLRDVFSITGDSMGTTSNLSSNELDDLVRYLLELDDVAETVPVETPSHMENAARSSTPSGCAYALTISSGREAVVFASALVLCRLVRRRRFRVSCPLILASPRRPTGAPSVR
jgi:DNA-binding beta-propeller fold protein YncE